MKHLVALLAVLLLAGCATTPAPRGGQSAALLSAWQLNGRVSLTRGEEGWHASLRWQEQADSYFLKISGPLGQGGFQLNGDSHGVVLVDALRYWIRGLPAPAAAKAQARRDESGRLSQLIQAGWTIKYNRYQLVNGVSLPGKLQLLHDDISVRIVVDKWELGAVTPRLP
jgi:outer membrane lipoprotein LolB